MPATVSTVRHIRTLSTLGALGALAMLAGCASTSGTTGSTGGFQGDLSPIDNYDWIVELNDEPMLAYGVPNSDDAPLVMTCQPRSGQVEVSLMSASVKSKPIAMATSSMTRSINATGQPEEMSGGYMLQGQIAADDALFDSAHETGWIAVRPDDTWVALVPQPGTRLNAKGFAQACRR